MGSYTIPCPHPNGGPIQSKLLIRGYVWVIYGPHYRVTRLYRRIVDHGSYLRISTEGPDCSDTGTLFIIIVPYCICMYLYTHIYMHIYICIRLYCVFGPLVGRAHMKCRPEERKAPRRHVKDSWSRKAGSLALP